MLVELGGVGWRGVIPVGSEAQQTYSDIFQSVRSDFILYRVPDGSKWPIQYECLFVNGIQDIDYQNDVQ